MILKEFSNDVKQVFDEYYPNQKKKDAIYDLAECFEEFVFSITTDEKELVAKCVGEITIALSNLCDKMEIDYPESVDKYWREFRSNTEKQKYADSMAANA